MKKIIAALVALLMAGPAMAADGWLYALEGAMAEVVQANQSRLAQVKDPQALFP